MFGVDNENDYYDVHLKADRRKQLLGFQNFRFFLGDLADAEFVQKITSFQRIEYICHLAAQAGVRYSIDNPSAYIQSNLVGFSNVLEAARQHNVRNFVYASSSSVYGNNEKQPSSVEDRVDHPVSLYAATKKSNELIAHAYSHLF